LRPPARERNRGGATCLDQRPWRVDAAGELLSKTVEYRLELRRVERVFRVIVWITWTCPPGSGPRVRARACRCFRPSRDLVAHATLPAFQRVQDEFARSDPHTASALEIAARLNVMT
jgi:hypothetical protein